MRIHIIACRVFQRELSFFSAQSEHNITITWLPQGLHNTPQLLQKSILAAMEEALQPVGGQLRPAHPIEAFVLAYGLCSNGVVGIEAEEIPIVVPRTDDCIALFLGSQERYLKYFREKAGTFWLNNGWLETSFLPFRRNVEALREEYAELYGEDNAEYLVEQELQFIKDYRFCGYITSEVYESPAYRQTAKELAAEQELGYFELEGNCRMLQKLVNAAWDEEEFLICPPGFRIEPSYEADKLRAVPV